MAKERESELEVFGDADYAGCEKTRRSTLRVAALVAGAALSVMSQLRRTTALSTTKAEIVAAGEGAKELIWLNRSERSALPGFLGMASVP